MANRTATLATAGLAVTAIMAGAAVAQPTIVSEAGYSITFNGNQQAFFSNTWDGSSQQAPNNIALSGQGSTAFASSQYGAGGHLTANANDGVYGNNRSWLSNLTGTDAFVGIAFPAAQSLSSIAWGRDNGRNNIATPAGGGDTNQSSGQFLDRSAGTYTLQFTTVASPDASTPSILFLEGRGLPVRAAMVGKRSIVPVSSSQTEPAGIPGPRIRQGTRCPPSKVVPFPSRKGPAEPPW